MIKESFWKFPSYLCPVFSIYAYANNITLNCKFAYRCWEHKIVDLPLNIFLILA